MSQTIKKLSDEIRALDTYKDVMRKFIKQGHSFEQTMDEPEMKEIVALLKDSLDYYKRVYAETFIYLWAFQGTYTIDYFIQKFEAIPEEAIDEKTVYTLCGEGSSGPLKSPEMIALNGLVYARYLAVYYICSGGGEFDKLGKTPKERLMTALKGLRTQWLNQQELTEPWGEYENHPSYFA